MDYFTIYVKPSHGVFFGRGDHFYRVRTRKEYAPKWQRISTRTQIFQSKVRTQQLGTAVDPVHGSFARDTDARWGAPNALSSTLINLTSRESSEKVTMALLRLQGKRLHFILRLLENAKRTIRRVRIRSYCWRSSKKILQ